jgi:predicted metalloprotease with PDZ domain
MQGVFEAVAGAPMGDLFDAWIRSAAEIDVAATLAKVGLAVQRATRADTTKCSLGLRIRSEGGRAVVASVTRSSAAQHAGLDPGDEVLGIGGARVENGNIEAALRGRSGGETVDVVVGRDGKMLTRQATLDPPRADRVTLVAKPDAPESARAAFRAWIGRPHPAWEEEGAAR